MSVFDKINEALQKEIKSIGLLDGDAGELIYNYISGNYSVEMINDSLSKCLDIISTDTVSFFFSNGLSGLTWLFSYFSKKGVLEVDEDELFEEIDEYLFQWMMKRSEEEDFDFMYGAIGVGTYFLNRKSSSKINEYINQLFANLEKLINQKTDHIPGYSFFDNERKVWNYNLSLAHGLPGLIALLVKVYELNPHSKKTEELLRISVDRLLLKRFSESDLNEIEKGRYHFSDKLAWCNGDLGIGITLNRVGKICNDVNLQNLSMKILSYYAHNLVQEKYGVLDSGICHGTSGIGHCFHRIYLSTGEELFKRAADYWFTETYNRSTFMSGIAGFKTWSSKDGWRNETNLRQGVSGIGLALYCWENKINPDWDSCLLLS